MIRTAAPSRTLSRRLRRLPRLPLLQKIVLANVMLLSGLLVALLVVHPSLGGPVEGGRVSLVVPIGLAAVALANAVLAYLALRPLRAMERTAEQVEAGHVDARIVEAEERERKRVADELLGDTAQLVAAALLQLKVAARGMDDRDDGSGKPEKIRQKLEPVRTELQLALGTLLDVGRRNRPRELDDRDLDTEQTALHASEPPEPAR